MMKSRIYLYFLIGILQSFMLSFILIREYRSYKEYLSLLDDEIVIINESGDLGYPLDNYFYVDDIVEGDDTYRDIESPFGSVSAGGTKKDLDTNILDKEFLVDFYAFMDALFYSFPEPKSWENWDKDNYYVSSYVLSVDRDNRLMDIHIALPEDKTFSNIWLNPSIECTPNNSAVLSNYNFELRQVDVDIFDYAEEGDALFTYCLDDECKSIGKSCILIKKEKNEE